MAQGEKRKKAVSKYAGLISILLLVAVLAVTFLTSGAVLTPKRYDVVQGSIMPETVYAPREIVDAAATNTLKQAAMDSTQPAYSIDAERIDALTTQATGYFDALYTVRSSAIKLMPSEDTGSQYTALRWQELLTDEQMSSLCSMTVPRLTQEQLLNLLAASQADVQYLEDIVMPKLTIALEGGLNSDSIENVRKRCIQELEAVSRLSSELKGVGDVVFTSFMDTTYVVDEEKTDAKKALAAEKVAPITVKKGEVIIESGSVLTQSQYDMLSELELIRTDGNDTWLIVGAGVFLLTVYVVFTVYTGLIQRNVFLSIKSMLIISVSLVITQLLSWPCASIDAYITPALIAVMLISLMVNDGTALASGVLLALTQGLITGGRGGIFSGEALTLTSAVIAAGCVSVYALKKVRKRGTIIAAGVIGGATGTLIIAGAGLMSGDPAMQVVINCAWFIGSCTVSAILVVGSMTIWENIFDVATSARLNELLNTNNPLLKQLMQEAPGTYQHCVSVAALSEAAAQRVGADPLLARVGAMYHDVGKLRRPLYFKENQKPDENIHDTLPPAESAAAIIAHQKDSVTLLTKFKFPSAVIKIAGEHHGDSLVAYFWYKAQQAEPEAQLNQKQFCYNGQRPSTKESAIVMLADSCEAAVRSLGECTREAREEMVHKVILGKMKDTDNMLSEAPLTLGQISDIEKSFLKTLGGLMHDRIEYPGQEAKTK